MKLLHALMVCLMLGISSAGYAKDDPKEIPPKDNWEQTNERTNSSPRLYQGESDVYVYSEKQLDNLTIGITDMMGNVYHYEVTTVPACTYYAVSIASLPAGTYYLSIYQESKYMIGVFTIN